MASVGIDLGTTYSCVAVWRNGLMEVIPNEQGCRTTPSIVAFTATGRLIGESAKNQAPFNPCNTVFGTKRLIGRRFDDNGLQKDLRHWPYTVINIDGKPNIQVEYRGRQSIFAPEEISAMVLHRMKEIAETFLGTPVSDAVITVPAYFTDAQRQATRAAGIIAGLNVLRIINEPTAAALAFGMDSTERQKGGRNILIYDLGGGTFDVSILTIGDDSVYEVKSTAGVTHLGGVDFDNRLVAHFADDFRKQFQKDLVCRKALRRLRNEAERAKMLLTSATEATIEVESLVDGIDYRGRITRELFEEICTDLFRATIPPLERVLIDANMSKSDIHDIILVGGSTRMPKVKSMIYQFFDRRILTTAKNPDEAVASGAAVQAAIIQGENHQRIRELLLIDVTPLSLGIEVSRGIMKKIIKRNTVIPCCHTKEVTTLQDNQEALSIEVFEGERELTKDNNLLGTFNLTGIPPAPRGVPKIDVTFNIDANGILSVIAKDKCTGHSDGLIVNNSNRLNQIQIEKMIADAKRFREEDIENRKRLEVKDQLEAYIYRMKHKVNEAENVLYDKETAVMNIECNEALLWLEDNKDSMREEYERKHTELMNRWAKITNKLLLVYSTFSDASKRFKHDANIEKH